MKTYGFSEENILKQIKDEYDYGFQHIESKREIRKDDLKLYVRESQEDRVDIHSIYTAIQTLLSINYLNEIAVEFTKRKNGDEEIAANANIVAEFDYSEMKLDIKDYIWEFNRLTTGVGIQTSGGFDFISVHPIIQNVDTLSYIFDPKGGPTIEDHRFFGIESEMTKDEMENAGYENLDNLDDYSITLQENQENISETRWETYVQDYTQNKKYTVYIHGTIIKGEKYIAVCSGDCRNLLSFKKLLPVFDEEKKDPSKIHFPIAFKYFSYVPGESMGVSPFDLLRSKQSAYSILFNLMLKMAYKNAMGGDRLINTEKIKDLAGISVPSLEGKDIPVNLERGESLNDVISYVQKDSPTNLPTELRSWLSEESILDTGIDRNTQGVLAQGNNTLGEREMAQKNANLRFLLGSKQAMWGEMFRWKNLWYRVYSANLKSIDKKEFALETGYSADFHAFTKQDFIGSDMLHLKLQSKAEVQQEMEKMKLDRLSRYPQEIQEAMASGQKWKVILLQRNRMLDVGETLQRTMQVYPYTNDELNAMDKMKVLKLAMENNENVDGKIAQSGMKVDNIDEQHEVFIELYQTLPDNPIKREAISRRYEAIKARGTQEEQMQQSTATNTAGNVAVAQATSQQAMQGKGTPSLQDITA